MVREMSPKKNIRGRKKGQNNKEEKLAAWGPAEGRGASQGKEAVSAISSQSFPGHLTFE